MKHSNEISDSGKQRTKKKQEIEREKVPFVSDDIFKRNKMKLNMIIRIISIESKMRFNVVVVFFYSFR